MAAGVGKTYRMLQEGRQAAARGRRRRDRLPRAARPARDGGARRGARGGAAPALEPRRPRARRDGRRRRHRAHGPSSRSSTSSPTRTSPRRATRKRYEDIEEILAAGIAVTSTVNIQHLESLNDEVFELTGVRVRETFPDRILDEADEVVLVDLTPEALQDAPAGRQGLPERAGPRSRSRTSSGSTTSRRCASSCCASSPRTSRRGARRACSTRSASRRSPSGSSCS